MTYFAELSELDCTKVNCNYKPKPSWHDEIVDLIRFRKLERVEQQRFAKELWTVIITFLFIANE